jgi:hypothetical protein
MMIAEIPEGQVCQAFDPMMILPEKTFDLALKKPPNTSCVAPAYVYIEGTRGKKFLCDYHYFYEKSMTSVRDQESWSKIEEVFIDEREKVKETFAKVGHTERTFSAKCWCENEAFVKVTLRDGFHTGYLCNFHFRKKLYREMSNDIDTYKESMVFDERSFMKTTIAEEAEKAKWV